MWALAVSNHTEFVHFLDLFSILERDQSILNPVSEAKLREFGAHLDLQPGDEVLDVASGKGTLLRLLAAQYGVRGTGLELNPLFVRQSRQHAEAAGLTEQLTCIEGPALDFQAEAGHYAAVTCLGLPDALGGFAEALGWMKRALAPGGTLAIGEVFLPAPVPASTLNGTGFENSLSLTDIQALLDQAGLELTGMVAASPDDWDRYASDGWRAAHRWATQNPDHPQRAELLEQVRRGRESHLSFIRSQLGWAIFEARLRA